MICLNECILALKGHYTLAMGVAHRRRNSVSKSALKGRDIIAMGGAH